MAALGRVMGALCDKLPQYQQVFDEMREVAAEQLEGASAELEVQVFGGQSQTDAPPMDHSPPGAGVFSTQVGPSQQVGPPPVDHRPPGAGVYSTQAEVVEPDVDTPAHVPLGTPGRGRPPGLREDVGSGRNGAPRVREPASVTATKQWVAVTTNCTAWGSFCKQVEAWRNAAETLPQFILVQEHHLEKSV
eukprot:6489605-Amphidinium_carterae.1